MQWSMQWRVEWRVDPPADSGLIPFKPRGRSMLCASGHADGGVTDTCQGDSGGASGKGQSFGSLRAGFSSVEVLGGVCIQRSLGLVLASGR